MVCTLRAECRNRPTIGFFKKNIGLLINVICRYGGHANIIAFIPSFAYYIGIIPFFQCIFTLIVLGPKSVLWRFMHIKGG